MQEFKNALFGFKRREVREYVKRLNQNYTATLADQQERVHALREENHRLTARLMEYEARENQVAQALIEASRRADAMIAESAAEAKRRQSELNAVLEGISARKVELAGELAQAMQQAMVSYRQLSEQLETLKADLTA